ncbi:MAG: DMT family transporter [Nitriliruptoraceae bacterium]|nr:DMT family transporter [Nitriliruptoraceae bacterium]
MPVEALAVLAATCYAFGHITVKFATTSGGVVLGFLISLGTGIVALSGVALVTVDDWGIPLGPASFFAAAGIAGPGLGRVLMMRAVRDAGTSVAAPLQASTNPVISSLAGVLLLGEVMDPGRIAALGLIVAGIWSCARGGSANRRSDVVSTGLTARGWVVLLWPLAAGMAFAGADVLRKYALDGFGDPVLGALIGLAVAFVIWLIVFLASPRLRATARFDPRLAWFGAYGLLSAAGLTSLLFALRGGDLSVVIPIFASQPVLVIVLGAVLLRDLERLRPGTVIGAMLVVTAVTYLALS